MIPQNKYRNKRVVFEGVPFDSEKEKNRFVMLRLLLTAGEITDLIHQPEYTLLEPFVDNQGNKIRGITYRGDFEYIKGGVKHCEDVKGFKTKEYLLKRKFFLAKFKEIIFLET